VIVVIAVPSLHKPTATGADARFAGGKGISDLNRSVGSVEMVVDITCPLYVQQMPFGRHFAYLLIKIKLPAESVFEITI
jgi:hypothetical protein